MSGKHLCVPSGFSESYEFRIHIHGHSFIMTWEDEPYGLPFCSMAFLLVLDRESAPLCGGADF